MAVLSPGSVEFEVSIPVLIIGGGACGLVAALAVRDQGAQGHCQKKLLEAARATA